MYADPNVTEETVTIVVRFATDSKHEAVMRDEIRRALEPLEALGHDVEILGERTAEVRVIPGAYVGRDREVVDERRRRIWPPPERARRYRAPHMRRGIVLGCSLTEAEGFVAGFEAAS